MGVLQGDLRAKRASVDTGTGVKRVSDTGRAAHIGRGTFVNWQDDLGISATEPVAAKARTEQARFEGDISKRYGALDEARGKLSTARGKVAEGEAAIAADLENFKKWYGWNPNVSGEQAQKSYIARVSRPSPGQFGGGSAREGQSDEEFAARQAKAQAERDALVAGASDTARFGDATGSWDPYRGSTKFKKLGGGDKAKVRAELIKAQKVFDANKAQVEAAKASLGEQEGILKGHADVIKGYEDINKAEWDTLHTKYKNRQETMKKILGGMKVG